MLRVKHVIINHSEGETYYEVDRPDWEINRMLMEIERQHPSTTSVIITLVKDGKL